MKRIVLFISSLVFSGMIASAQVKSIDEAKSVLETKTKSVSQPGIRYDQTFSYDESRPGLVILTVTSTDSKAKVVTKKTEFYIEHIDVNKILPITGSNLMKLQVYAKGDEQLFKQSDGVKSGYNKLFDLFFDDSQTMRDGKDALTYIVKNSTAGRLGFSGEADAYNWMESHIKKNFSANGFTYDVSLVVDRTNGNRISYTCNETDAKGQQIQKKFEFYMADFNVSSFKALAVKNILAVNLVTTNNAKAVKYFENGVQKSFTNKFDILLDEPKLAMDLIRSFRYIKTGTSDDEPMPVETPKQQPKTEDKPKEQPKKK